MQCWYLTLHNTYSFKVCSISEEEEKLTTGIGPVPSRPGLSPFSFVICIYLCSDKFGDEKAKLVEDVDVLMESASQTSFLYTLAFHLWQKVF